MTIRDAVTDACELTRAERAFIEAVLVCHGVHGTPSEAQFTRAMKVLMAYAQQIQDNPPEGPASTLIRRSLVLSSAQDRIKIAAAAFVKFGATKPTIFQVRAAQRELLESRDSGSAA